MKRRTTAATTPVTDPAELTPPQREALAVAKAWWQEGDRALDYLAEKARQERTLNRLRPLYDALRAEREPGGELLAPILPLARAVTGNRALNRTLLTDTFATSLRDLLFGEEALPVRLTAFLQNERVGEQTTSHLLYTAFPDRFPPVSDANRAVLAPSPAQRAALRTAVAKRYDLDIVETPRPVMTLLAEISLYEAAREALGAGNFVEVNSILAHAAEMPKGAVRRAKAKRTGAVREATAGYAPSAAPATEADLVALLESEIIRQGFTFPALTVRNYYIALKAKPFVILTGLSGTGKTRLTRLFADVLTGDTPDQYLLLPVRPDWTDSSPLLGYHNLLADRYVSTPFLSLLMLAAQPENRERVFVAVLDEMNLARVEHYFADLLSAMETPDGRIPLQEGRFATLPANVFLTGSVNVDEATHPFSRKVLDRANTIEFTQVHFGERGVPVEKIAATARPDIPLPERQRLFLAGRVRTLAEARERLAALDPAYPDRVQDTLSDLNALLEARGMHFGYRVRDEVMRYIAAAFTAEGEGLLNPHDRDTNLTTALDLQIVQKVLPRVSGTEETLGKLLTEVEGWAVARGLSGTAAKLARMRARANEDGIVSFYEL
jgi:MoxR-like ATPase